MAGRKPSKTLKEYEEKYKEQRSVLWTAFKQELDRLQHNHGVAVTELAEGLGISRQRFYDFQKVPAKGLPIDQIGLIVLWEWLTDPEVLSDRRMSDETREKRKQLRQEGPNLLLKAAGFLALPGYVGAEDRQESIAKVDSSLKRVEARLSSPWIEDGIRRAQIIDAILDEVKAQGRLDQTLHTQPIDAKEALGWLQGMPLQITNPTIIHAYQKKIRSLARSGKKQFVGVELFELYQNLLEYLSIDSYAGTKVDIVDCQFPILSAPLPTSVQHEFEVFSPIYRQAEKILLKRLCDLEDFDLDQLDSTALFTPVVRALITSQFEVGSEPIIWRYSSTGTHLENMLSAINSGLGHNLEITGFSIQATGTTSRSLARVSIGLAERDQMGKIGKVYQGWWVDSNAITAILVATIIATKDWLSSRGADLYKYFSICYQLGDIDDYLYLIRENVQEYFFRSASGYLNKTDTLDDEDFFNHIESKISEIDQFLSLEQQRKKSYYKTRHQAVKNRLIKTKLTRIRLALKNSDVKRVTQRIEEARSFIANYENAKFLEANNESEEDAYHHILFIHASECVMLHNFYVGDREFLAGKLWRYRSRYRVEDGLKKLEKYLKAVRSINFDAFSWASQMFGVIGLLELYMAQEKDRAYLEEAAEYLLYASHYSLRIGYIRRTTYWLTHASRVYCRLGDLEKSERLSKIVKVTADSVHQTHEDESDYDSKFKTFIRATIDLSEGERSLVRGEPERAIVSFLGALKSFVELHSTDRLTADVLYGLYRASCEVEAVVGDAFMELRDDGKTVQSKQGIAIVFQDILQTLKQISPKSSWCSVSPLLKDLSKAIWHHWATGGGETSEAHPIEEEIDRDRFLTPLISS